MKRAELPHHYLLVTEVPLVMPALAALFEALC